MGEPGEGEKLRLHACSSGTSIRAAPNIYLEPEGNYRVRFVRRKDRKVRTITVGRFKTVEEATIVRNQWLSNEDKNSAPH